MTAALFTRDTLDRIRADARTRPAPDIAHDLDWELARLRRVAVAHGIELINPNPMMNGPVQRPAQSRQADITPDMTLDEILLALPGRHAQVLRALSTQIDGNYMSRPDILDRTNLGDADQTVTTVMHELEQRLRTAGTRWQIDRCRGRLGGCRLVQVGAPAAPAAPAAAPTVIDLSLLKAIEALPPRQREVLTLLAEIEDGAYLSTTQIANRLKYKNVEMAMDAIARARRNFRVARVCWQIEAAQKRNGGYRLVKVP